MARPTRIQRKRTKGWRAPEGTIMCTRPGKWGNQWVVRRQPIARSVAEWVVLWNERVVSRFTTRAEAVASSLACFRIWLRGDPDLMADFRAGLSGAKHLGCWCSLASACHVDIIIQEVFGDV